MLFIVQLMLGVVILMTSIKIRMETIEMKALRIKNILNSLEEKIESGNITIREAAIELHKAGWINYIDIDTTKKLLGLN